MTTNQSDAPGVVRILVAALCLLLAWFLLVQLIGLLFIGQIADRAAESGQRVHVPVYVRGLGLMADRLHEDVLKTPLDPHGSNWPQGFRWFFTLQVCGLAGLCIGATQLAFGVFCSRTAWLEQARSILFWSGLAMLVGFLLLQLTFQ